MSRLKARFAYSCLDRILSADDPDRVCDHCKAIAPASQSYCLTPLDFSQWTEKSLLEFGLNRCKDCIPADAISADEYFSSPREGWHLSAKVHETK